MVWDGQGAWDAGKARLDDLDAPLAGLLARGLGMPVEDYRAALSKVTLLASRDGRAMLAGRSPALLASIERIERLTAGADASGAPRPTLSPGDAP